MSSCCCSGRQRKGLRDPDTLPLGGWRLERRVFVIRAAALAFAYGEATKAKQMPSSPATPTPASADYRSGNHRGWSICCGAPIGLPCFPSVAWKNLPALNTQNVQMSPELIDLTAFCASRTLSYSLTIRVGSLAF